MRKRTLEYIRQYGMIVPGDVCLVGLSGGADSVCLLLLLEELAGTLGCRVAAVHVNHNLRGAEALRDQAFCRRLCRERGIPLYEYSVQVEEEADRLGIGTEEAGRLLRRRVFADCMKAHGGTKLALAHHQNDLAETFLFHLARGTSLDGLAALRPVRGEVIRPLLWAKRSGIEKYLTGRAVTWCQDSTNGTDAYTRNRIRRHVIPELEEQVNAGAVGHIAAVSGDILETSLFLEDLAEELLERETQICRTEGIRVRVRLFRAGFFAAPPLLQRKAAMKSMEEILGRRRDLTRKHLEMFLALWQNEVGSSCQLPGGLRARRTYEGVVLEDEIRADQTAAGGTQGEGTAERFVLPLPRQGSVQAGAYRVETRVLPWRGQIIPQKTYTKWLDYDKIGQNAVLRTRRSGDYLVINAAGGRKKLKDYLIDSKVPREERDSLLLLAAGSEILWVVGLRIGESAKIGDSTRQMIQIHITGGNTNE